MILGYESTVLLSGILGMYARYNFLQSFQDVKHKTFGTEVIGYVLFYFSLMTIYFVFDIPVLNLIVQIIFLNGLALISGMRMKKALIATSIIIIVIVAIDSIVYFASGYVSASVLIEADYSSTIGVISIDLLTLLVSRLFKNYKNVSKGMCLPFAYWCAIFTFPIVSLLLLIIIFKLSNESKTIVVGSTLMVLIMNLIIFWLYDHLIFQYNKKIEEAVIQQMNRNYKKQIEMMRTSVINTKSFEHDINKHLVSIESLLKNDKCHEACLYLIQMRDSINSNCMISNTGNLIIDSIINFELSSYDIDPDKLKLTTGDIPTEIRIKDYDLTVVFSNVLSNALRSAKKINGHVKIHINFTRGVLYILVTNEYSGEILLKENKFITSFNDKANHGFGIENIRKAVGKYEGDFKTTYDNNFFKAEIVMYESA